MDDILDIVQIPECDYKFGIYHSSTQYSRTLIHHIYTNGDNMYCCSFNDITILDKPEIITYNDIGITNLVGLNKDFITTLKELIGL